MTDFSPPKVTQQFGFPSGRTRLLAYCKTNCQSEVAAGVSTPYLERIARHQDAGIFQLFRGIIIRVVTIQQAEKKHKIYLPTSTGILRSSDGFLCIYLFYLLF